MNKTMNELKTLKTLAADFLALPASEKAKRFGITLKAEKLLKNYNYSSRARLLKDLQVSYLASVNSSQKIEKGKDLNFDTLICYLAASNNAGVELCEFATAGCRAACLVESGHALLEKRAGKNKIAISRILKSWLAVFRKDIFDNCLAREIELASRRAKRNGARFAVRLNGTSDICFADLRARFPNIKFYDYTKNPARKETSNYHLTFSFSNNSKPRVKHYQQALKAGLNIALPIIKTDFEKCLKLAGCYNADKTDLRFLDNRKKSRFALLGAKLTPDTARGVQAGFILDYKAFKSIHGKLAAAL